MHFRSPYGSHDLGSRRSRAGDCSISFLMKMSKWDLTDMVFIEDVLRGSVTM